MVIDHTALLEVLRGIYAAAVPRDGKFERRVKRLCVQYLGEDECRQIAAEVRQRLNKA